MDPQGLKSMGKNDVPATVGLVRAVRDELLAETRAHRNETAAMEKRLEGKLELMTAEIRRSSVLIEEQHARNQIVLDGLKLVLDRQDRLEANLRG